MAQRLENRPVVLLKQPGMIPSSTFPLSRPPHHHNPTHLQPGTLSDRLVLSIVAERRVSRFRFSGEIYISLIELKR